MAEFCIHQALAKLHLPLPPEVVEDHVIPVPNRPMIPCPPGPGRQSPSSLPLDRPRTA
jgi:hypothetical protein